MNLFLAAGTAPPPGGSIGDTFVQMFPLLLFIAVFYYLFVARPMKQKQKQFQDLMSTLKKGDRVLTNSGMYGDVMEILERRIKLRIANNVVVEMEKSAISGPDPGDSKKEESKKEEKK